MYFGIVLGRYFNVFSLFSVVKWFSISVCFMGYYEYYDDVYGAFSIEFSI